MSILFQQKLESIRVDKGMTITGSGDTEQLTKELARCLAIVKIVKDNLTKAFSRDACSMAEWELVKRAHEEVDEKIVGISKYAGVSPQQINQTPSLAASSSQASLLESQKLSQLETRTNTNPAPPRRARRGRPPKKPSASSSAPSPLAKRTDEPEEGPTFSSVFGRDRRPPRDEFIKQLNDLNSALKVDLCIYPETSIELLNWMYVGINNQKSLVSMISTENAAEEELKQNSIVELNQIMGYLITQYEIKQSAYQDLQNKVAASSQAESRKRVRDGEEIEESVAKKPRPTLVAAESSSQT